MDAESLKRMRKDMVDEVIDELKSLENKCFLLESHVDTTEDKLVMAVPQVFFSIEDLLKTYKEPEYRYDKNRLYSLKGKSIYELVIFPTLETQEYKYILKMYNKYASLIESDKDSYYVEENFNNLSQEKMEIFDNYELFSSKKYALESSKTYYKVIVADKMSI